MSTTSAAVVGRQLDRLRAGPNTRGKAAGPRSPRCPRTCGGIRTARRLHGTNAATAGAEGEVGRAARGGEAPSTPRCLRPSSTGGRVAQYLAAYGRQEQEAPAEAAQRPSARALRRRPRGSSSGGAARARRRPARRKALLNRASEQGRAGRRRDALVSIGARSKDSDRGRPGTILCAGPPSPESSVE